MSPTRYQLKLLLLMMLSKLKQYELMKHNCACYLIFSYVIHHDSHQTFQ